MPKKHKINIKRLNFVEILDFKYFNFFEKKNHGFANFFDKISDPYKQHKNFKNFLKTIER